MVSEQTPLLIDVDSTIQDEAKGREEQQQVGHATFQDTVINLCKTCMGTGVLALPYAVNQGGLLCNTVGLFAIAAWNWYSVERLCNALSYVKEKEAHLAPPPAGTATFGKVAWYALGGQSGLYALDVTMVILLSGILVAYEDAIVSFLRDTPLSSGSIYLDALLCNVVIAALASGHMAHLSGASAIGLIILALTLLIIACYGSFTNFWLAHSLWPQNGLSGISNWFGCTVFGYGIIPLTYNFRESMKEPQHMVSAAGVALTAVATAYIIIGTGLLLLYPNIEADVLQELPVGGFLPTLVRLAMAAVILMTAPLLLVPCGELLEGKLGVPITTWIRVAVRLAILFVCGTIGVAVPGFVDVLSFVGCFCVSLVGFIVAPLLHLVLVLSSNADHDAPSAARIRTTVIVDILLVSWGVVATIISSGYTFRQMTKKSGG